jgi:hypothetical protein
MPAAPRPETRCAGSRPIAFTNGPPFIGLTVEESAQIPATVDTVLRSWRLARLCLLRGVQRGVGGGA